MDENKTEDNKNTVVKEKNCKDCNAEFFITQGELDWLKNQFGDSFAEPGRCKNCRHKRKLQKTNKIPE